MSQCKIYESNLLAAIHETVSDLHEAELVSKCTMREFDEMCLIPIESLNPEQIRAIREQQNISQAVFAKYLNVSSSLISKWERGEKKPSGSSLKLLVLVQKKGISVLI